MDYRLLFSPALQHSDSQASNEPLEAVIISLFCKEILVNGL